MCQSVVRAYTLCGAIPAALRALKRNLKAGLIIDPASKRILQSTTDVRPAKEQMY
jgi:hypothetical protein